VARVCARTATSPIKRSPSLGSPSDAFADFPLPSGFVPITELSSGGVLWEGGASDGAGSSSLRTAFGSVPDHLELLDSEEEEEEPEAAVDNAGICANRSSSLAPPAADLAKMLHSLQASRQAFRRPSDARSRPRKQKRAGPGVGLRSLGRGTRLCVPARD
jgi:hypothetical protein